MPDNLRIIIAEDDEGHALLIRKNLKKSGLSAQYVHLVNGEEVINFFSARQENYSTTLNNTILLLDIKMPKVNGLEVLKMMHKNEEWKKIPVYVISTSDNQKDALTCKTLGCQKYIVKPVDYAAFASTIQNLGKALKELKLNTY
jgi:CheY-like chemotaxis protein